MVNAYVELSDVFTTAIVWNADVLEVRGLLHLIFPLMRMEFSDYTKQGIFLFGFLHE